MKLAALLKLVFLVEVILATRPEFAAELPRATIDGESQKDLNVGSCFRRLEVAGSYSKRSGYSDFHIECFSSYFFDKKSVSNLRDGGDYWAWSTFNEANVSDPPEWRKVSPANMILEYVITDKKSLFHVANGVFLSDSNEGEFSLAAIFETKEDGIGYRVYDRVGKMLGSEFFKSPDELRVNLESRPEGKLDLHVAEQTNGITVQWSIDHGITWSEPTIYQLNMPDDAMLRIPKHVLAKNSEIMLEFDIMVGMKLYRKRFVYSGDGKPLKGVFPQRSLRKSRDFAKGSTHSDGWLDYKEPIARPNEVK